MEYKHCSSCISGALTRYYQPGQLNPAKAETISDVTDDNECSTSPSICGTAKCQNTVGSYSCSCPPGTTFDSYLLLCVGDGGSVSPVGSCMNSPCSFGCISTGIASYVCACPDGYQKIGQGIVVQASKRVSKDPSKLTLKFKRSQLFPKMALLHIQPATRGPESYSISSPGHLFGLESRYMNSMLF
ncbi:hypothetical protein LAZ67_2004326 [Cordylochernes scorpioides]|uniref:EGF-like domain-containing protein n=1 Tax=Cordylochernes scorpioides TaxID=51811 RepID=A0ABY6K4I5_9ARAC|nr:hypothetical protein LAZ67_2004326 [Cordylochernes scorpioides]